MEISGKIYCLFEQSGTFRDVFRELGYPACDYDISNYFGKTDFVMDIFAQIDLYNCGVYCLFNSITPDDLIIAFFPCTYFEVSQLTYYDLSNYNYRNKSMPERISIAQNRIRERTKFHLYLYELVKIAYERNLRLIIENPAREPNYLIGGQNFPKPSIIDYNRQARGDYYRKPTAYWFFNCEPTRLHSSSMNKVKRCVNKTWGHKVNGNYIERSLISPIYARNFICDFILGVKQSNTIPTLFE